MFKAAHCLKLPCIHRHHRILDSVGAGAGLHRAYTVFLGEYIAGAALP